MADVEESNRASDLGGGDKTARAHSGERTSTTRTRILRIFSLRMAASVRDAQNRVQLVNVTAAALNQDEGTRGDRAQRPTAKSVV